jgi:hypothetical protein
MRTPFLAVSVVVVAASCSAPSEDEVQAEFEAFVEKNNACTTTDECVIFAPGCPLGCEAVVSASRVDAAKAKARELIDDYESAGRSCQYSCAVPTVPVCEGGHCRTEPQPIGDGGGGACTLIGCGPAFALRFEKDGPWATGDYRVLVDLEGTRVECTATLPLSCDAPLSCDDPDVFLLLEGCALPPGDHALGGVEIQQGTPASISVEVIHGGDSLATGAWNPDYQTSRPNGPDCDPECTTAPAESLSIP